MYCYQTCHILQLLDNVTNFYNMYVDEKNPVTDLFSGLQRNFIYIIVKIFLQYVGENFYKHELFFDHIFFYRKNNIKVENTNPHILFLHIYYYNLLVLVDYVSQDKCVSAAKVSIEPLAYKDTSFNLVKTSGLEYKLSMLMILPVCL